MKRVFLSLAILFAMGFAVLNAAEYDIIEYQEQNIPTPFTQMLAADDTSDVGRIDELGYKGVCFHLIVSGITTSVNVRFEGASTSAESTYTNLSVDGLTYDITANGCHSYAFENQFGFRYYRWVWVTETGGTAAIISSNMTAGREY